jgi:small GTP-binding protein
VTLQIWDTAGQERYSSISQLFFRDSNVALLCFDPTDKASISGIGDWVKRVTAEVADCHLFAVLTKADTIDPAEFDCVIADTKTAIAPLNFEQFFVTSAVRTLGVDELFQAATEIYVKAPQASGGRIESEEDESRCC